MGREVVLPERQPVERGTALPEALLLLVRVVIFVNIMVIVTVQPSGGSLRVGSLLADESFIAAGGVCFWLFGCLQVIIMVVIVIMIITRRCW